MHEYQEKITPFCPFESVDFQFRAISNFHMFPLGFDFSNTHKKKTNPCEMQGTGLLKNYFYLTNIPKTNLY